MGYFPENVIYIKYHQGIELDWAFGDYYAAPKPLPLSALKKDGWQEIDMYGHSGAYGIKRYGASAKTVTENIITLSPWNDDYSPLLAETDAGGRRVISIRPGVHQALLFLDWEINEVEIILHFGGNFKVRYVFSSEKKLMSRYLPVIVVSTVEINFRPIVEKEWEGLVAVKKLQE